MKRLRITYCLRAQSGILIGSTAEVLSIGVDKTTMRRRHASAKTQGEPLIPGSTIKGKLRNECERLLAALGEPICRAPRAETMCWHNQSAGDGESQLCAVCQMFGCPTRKSRLFFSDARLLWQPETAAADDGKSTHALVDVSRFATRTQAGVSVSRKRRTVEEERLFLLERGVEGLLYQGEISGYLPDATYGRQLTVLLAAMEQLLAIGGGKSRGAGWTALERPRVWLDEEERSDAQLRKLREEEAAQWRENR